MKNTMIPEEEMAKIRKVIEASNNLLENHNALTPNIDVNDSVMRVHTLLYLEVVKDLMKTSKLLEALFEMDREKFIAMVTDDNKRDIRTVEREMMMSMLVDLMK